MTDYITLTLFSIGMPLFVIGLNNALTAFGEEFKGKLGIIIMIVGGFLLVSGFFYSSHTQKQWNDSLTEEIATKLNMDAKEIIVKDMEKDEHFNQSKNINLRKVYADNKTYIVEVKDYKVEKIVEQ